MNNFWWGCIGSISQEIMIIFQYFLHDEHDEFEIHPRYKQGAYYIIRILVVFIAGCLVIILEANTPKNAFVIGAAAPLIIKEYSRIKPAK